VNGDAWLALVGSVLIGLVVRMSNMVVEWLARALQVETPKPIPTTQDVIEERGGLT
jgi:hypothetical protein